MNKKGFTFSLSVMSFIITIFVALIIMTSIALMVMFHIHINKKFVIERVLEFTQAQDALLALLEIEQEGVKFKQALIYSIYEKSENPKIWNGEKIVEYNFKDIAKNFFNYVYEGCDAWLFIYNEKKDDIKTIYASKDNPEELFKKENKRSRRASFPIDEENWLVLYLNVNPLDIKG